jgi:spore coat protein U-like protein
MPVTERASAACAGLLVLVALLFACGSANAQVSCRLSGVAGSAFGLYDDSSAAPTDTASSVTVSCLRNGGPANVDMDIALGPSAGSGLVASRLLRSGARTLNYNLFRDSGRSAVWGQTSGADTLPLKLTGIPNNAAKDAVIVIYGRIPALQNAAAGVYADSVSIIVTP